MQLHDSRRARATMASMILIRKAAISMPVYEVLSLALKRYALELLPSRHPNDLSRGRCCIVQIIEGLGGEGGFGRVAVELQASKSCPEKISHEAPVRPGVHEGDRRGLAVLPVPGAFGCTSLREGQHVSRSINGEADGIIYGETMDVQKQPST